MIRPIPRRLAAVLAAFAFTLSFGEGVLASICAPEPETEACAEGVAVDALVAASGMGAHRAMGGAEVTMADPRPDEGPAARSFASAADPVAASGDACCLPGASGEQDSSPGHDAPAPCPFAVMGVAGSCTALSLPAPGHFQLPPSADAVGMAAASLGAPDLLLAIPPFQPPRA